MVDKYTPRITDPSILPYLSPAQIENVGYPSRGYAKDAFRNGLWNLKWGDPEDYGISIDIAINVSKPQNKDFAYVVFSKGFWNEKWGDPRKWGIETKQH